MAATSSASAAEGGGAISIEPGGQFELSGAPLADVHATARELDRAPGGEAKRVAEPLGIGFLDARHEPEMDAGRRRR